jgi:phosphoesterase RecJ-like protein
VSHGLVAELRSHETFLILGHVEPDGDCVASQLLLHGMLLRLGKRALLYNEGPFTRPEVLRHAGRFSAVVRPEDRLGDTAVVIVDCSTPERVGGLAKGIRGLRTLVIDHHASGSHFGDVRLIDSASPAVVLMLLSVLDALGLELTREEAELVLFGLCTDTAFFRHLDARSAGVFEAVARIVRHGASPQAAYHEIYGGRSLAERRRLGTTLAGTESLCGGSLLLCTQTEGEQDSGGGVSDELYRLLQTVSGVRIVVFIKQESGSGFSVGLRSSGGIDVGSVARLLGGGGHAPAAGCTLEGSLEQVRRRVLDAVVPLIGPPP